ncbi:MAG: NYN domain-containing protein [Candidatus Promineifilaceae bacterium]|nr:NYN domain-containing protein [Candidatus Promineifilaceae bacterium]
MISNGENQVAVFIDYENIELSCREKLGSDTEVDWSRVLESALELGRVVLRRAYGDWSLSSFRSGQRELLGLGIELVHIPSKRGKNAADIRIVIDALEMLMGDHANISHVLLVSGDGDFTELVHRLRGYGKVVVGLGVSGASAEYLINACDQFLFYDILASMPQKQGSGDGRGKGPQPSFDVSEARQLLRRSLQSREDEWVNGGQVKDAMLRFNPAFNEANYGFDSFKAFMAAQNDIVQLRTAAEGGHLEARLLPEEENGGRVADKAPEALLDRYLKYLAQQKIRMTPTEHRPSIILKFYDIYQQNPASSLTALKEELHAHFEEAAPEVKWQYVHETIHQLFRTYCFNFDQDDSKYPPEARLWDREVTLADEVTSPARLLYRCDRGLLQKVGRKVGEMDGVDTEVAARLLYGGVRGQRMLDHIQGILQELKENGHR